jgi:sphinganine-1-phosphate aldolase
MSLSKFLDSLLEGARPSQVVGKTLLACAVAHVAVALLSPGFVLRRLHALKWSVVRVVAAPIVNKKVADAVKDVKMLHYQGEPVNATLPATGRPHDELIAMCDEFHRRLDISHLEQRFSGVVYHGGLEFTAFINKVMEFFQWTNPLHFDSHGAVRKMEAEIVSMVVALFNGGPRGACGACTSGGTESIGMAMKTYRDWGREVRGITNPSIVMPITAHPAFDKACWYYGIEIIKVPVGASGAVDPQELVKYIKYNTVAIVGSAVTFPHGTFDPIPELAEIAHSRGIGLHVDACLGSFIVPLLTKAGFKDIPLFDFRLQGVTSISCDTHKYGFAPKGTSIIMYGSMELRSYHFFATADWPGGVYGSPGAAGSKPGNVIAGTWAALMSFGESGYTDTCRAIVKARITMTDGIKKLPGIVVYGNPQASVFGFGSTLVDIYTVSDRLKKLGWVLNSLQFPAGIQFSVTYPVALPGVAERFVEDVAAINGDLLRERETDIAAGRKPKIGAEGGSMYGSQQRVADRTLLNAVMKKCLDKYYSIEQ